MPDQPVFKADMTEDNVYLYCGNEKVATIERDEDPWMAVEKVLTELGAKILYRYSYNGEKEYHPSE